MGKLWLVGLAVLVTAIALSAVVQAKIPALPLYDVPSSISNYVYAIVPAPQNCSISGSNPFTITDVADNASSVILLQPFFSYLISGSGADVGLCYSNGTVAKVFSLGNGPVMIESYFIYNETNKTTVNAVYPCIKVSDGGKATVYVKVFIRSKVQLSAPSPPFSGQTFSGSVGPNDEGRTVWSRNFPPGTYNIAFWEAHSGYDVDFRARVHGTVVIALLADNGEWDTVYEQQFTTQWTGEVWCYRAPSSGSGPWMLVVQQVSTNEPTTTTTPEQTYTTVTTTPHPAGPIPKLSTNQLILIGIGTLILIAIIAAVTRR